MQAGIDFYFQLPVQGIYQMLQSNLCQDINDNIMIQGSNNISFESCKDQYFTLDSSSATTDLGGCDSSSCSSVLSSNRSPSSPQVSQSSDSTYGTPISGNSSIDNGDDELKHRLRELEISLLGSDESDVADSGGRYGASPSAKYDWDQIAKMIPKFKLRDVLMLCAQAVSDDDIPAAIGWMDNVLAKMVSVYGDPMQRLGAYLLEGLRARLESSGSLIYKSLKCEQPTGKELMSYIHILYQICPYWKFAYISANAVIAEAMANESMIHIIDFQIAQGTQWHMLIQALASRPGGPPFVRVTGVDDSQSFHARGGGLEIVGERLSNLARSCGVPFKFNIAAMCGSEVEGANLVVRPGEALAVNFPYVLHHMPDESVCTENHRDRVISVRFITEKMCLYIFLF